MALAGLLPGSGNQQAPRTARSQHPAPKTGSRSAPPRSAVSPSIHVCSRSQEPRKRLTYSQSHLSATVEPQDSEEEKRKAERKSRDAWLTPSGFQVTGLHSTGRTHHLGLPPPGAVTEVGGGSGSPAGIRRGLPLTCCPPT